MTKRKAKYIPLPSTWNLPKYRFGQLTREGYIVGMEYRPPGFQISVDAEGEWFYWVTKSLESDDLSSCDESNIELLSSEEMQSLVADEIEFHKHRIAALVQQLKITEKEHYAK